MTHYHPAAAYPSSVTGPPVTPDEPTDAERRFEGQLDRIRLKIESLRSDFECLHSTHESAEPHTEAVLDAFKALLAAVDAAVYDPEFGINIKE
jgi:hypothetical protein